MIEKQINIKSASREIIVWTVLVLLLSSICYLPMLLVKKGYRLPAAASQLINLKYFYVVIPAAISVLTVIRGGSLKKWTGTLFSEKITLRSVFVCIAAGGIGLAVSGVYAFFADRPNLFAENYPSFFSFVISCAYLFITALVEETAWRGFLLDKWNGIKGKGRAFFYTGLTWAVWHIPMWAVRNSLELKEIVFFFMWTLFISFILGMSYFSNKNLIAVSLLHMICNACFLASVSVNLILAGTILALAGFIGWKKGRRKEGIRKKKWGKK